MSSFNQESSIS